MVDTPLDKVQRWEQSGAILRVMSLDRRRAVVELCTCTGERMERLESSDAELLAYLRETRPGRPGPTSPA